ncbi:MAG: thioredoxin [Bacteroidales bacterium]|nr:thioredoxin [Bacteroidales bacterium]
MSTSLYIVLGFIVLFIVYIFYNYKKMKSLPNTPDHANVKTLNNKNFKTQVGSGLVLVDFWAPWCGPCKMMAPTLNSIADTENDKVKIGKVNVDHEQQLAKKFGIRSIPTLVLFKNGKEVKRFSGVRSKSFLMKEVSTVLS